MIYKIEIALKNNVRDTHGENVRHDIKYLGVKHPPKVKYFPLYQIEGDLNLREINIIAKNLLIDPITQTCTIRFISEEYKAEGKKQSPKHTVEVWYKHGVTDTVAESVVKAVGDLGVKKQINVKTGQKYLFESSISLPAVKLITERLLVNSLIQQYSIY